MTESKDSGGQIDPTPNCDTHLSKSVQIDLATTPLADAYESSQVKSFISLFGNPHLCIIPPKLVLHL
jgi:hypothetical protein